MTVEANTSTFYSVPRCAC